MQSILTELYGFAPTSLKLFVKDLNSDDQIVLGVLLAASLIVGYWIGKRRNSRTKSHRAYGSWRFPKFQNRGEALVSRVLRGHFESPDYHLMNHVTLRISDGTTQVDHILVSRHGVFVIETKDFNGWILGDAADHSWTQVIFRARFQFQNPIHQNYRHVRAVQDLLDFLPTDAIKSIVVFTGDAEFKTEIPKGVVTIDNLAEHVRLHTEDIITKNRMQFCVGRIETARLAISTQTDVEHVERLARKYGDRSA